jgi:hypothetical protein
MALRSKAHAIAHRPRYACLEHAGITNRIAPSREWPGVAWQKAQAAIAFSLGTRFVRGCLSFAQFSPAANTVTPDLIEFLARISASMRWDSPEQKVAEMATPQVARQNSH